MHCQQIFRVSTLLAASGEPFGSSGNEEETERKMARRDTRCCTQEETGGVMVLVSW